MYACATRLEADFSRGRTGKSIGHSLFMTHPHPGIRELVCASTAGLGILAAANLYSLLQHLVPGEIGEEAGRHAPVAPLDLSLRRIADMNFAEHLFPDVK
jgi:hypothetical protein